MSREKCCFTRLGIAKHVWSNREDAEGVARGWSKRRGVEFRVYECEVHAGRFHVARVRK